MIGGGNIGGGVYELVMGGRLRSTTSTSNSRDRGKTTRPVLITKICVKDLSKPRSFHLDDDVTIMTTNVDSIIHDPDIDMVVEVMGGTGLARTVVETALQNNKMVVTANKALIANHLDSIQKLLLLHNNMGFGYEAAVCGGIPIIQTLQSCYTGDVVHKIQGICNGTTNYMLEKMESGAEFEEVLKEAQELGYAEADPTADVEGLDVRAKICLLAKLAFGVTVPVQDVPCRGITLLEDVDFEYAKVLGCTIKLIGTAQRLHEAREWDGPLCVYVSPVMIPTKHVLGGISSNGNAVAVTSANMGTCSYLGPGAGRFPTANSVVADICRLADGKSAPPFPLQANLELDFDYISIFYIRIPFQDGLGIIKRVGELAEEAGVSINSILQTPIRDRMSADFCVTTEECKVSQVEELCQAINQQVDFCRAPCMFMPLMIEQIH
jgi:homoserine dehydrogenase